MATAKPIVAAPPILESIMKHNALLLGVLFGLPLVSAYSGAASVSQDEGVQRLNDYHRSFGPLVDEVRRATARYRDVNVATAEGWVPGTPCVSGPNEGAMGVHFILPSRIGDGVLNADEPEALIYEPLPGGAFRLVGVEFIVRADDWARLHPDGSTPAVDGHLTNYVGAPNRYGLPAFYELHVWAWEHNPQGSFADWNTQVTCERQDVK
jgi:hypothetical protein